ncbi:hypothetical protein RQP53_05505 [Paucibacter sp. APW11]|uniref:Uncharacterized protein n=1 Tax=Roseateles aquae TaxID=3077235 RepID=A0ABU3P8U5_9BURK|nr:hypothetical protein [Paucibacter sp. APW11]MDT8998722.1 hypothetical protein [Paucibacter sp. APW11]
MKSVRKPIGVGIVEVLATLAIVGILLAVAAPSFSDFLDRRRVEAATTEFASDIAFSKALIASNTTNINLSIGSACYSVAFFAGNTTCPCEPPIPNICLVSPTAQAQTQKTVQKTNGIRFSTSPQVQSNQRIIAIQASEVLPQPAYVEITGARSNSLRVEIGPVGRVRICSVSGNFSGYPTC